MIERLKRKYYYGCSIHVYNQNFLRFDVCAMCACITRLQYKNYKQNVTLHAGQEIGVNLGCESIAYPW